MRRMLVALCVSAVAVVLVACGDDGDGRAGLVDAVASAYEECRASMELVDHVNESLSGVNLCLAEAERALADVCGPVLDMDCRSWAAARFNEAVRR